MALSLARSLLADPQFAENMRNPDVEVEFRLGQVVRASNIRQQEVIGGILRKQQLVTNQSVLLGELKRKSAGNDLKKMDFQKYVY